VASTYPGPSSVSDLLPQAGTSPRSDTTQSYSGPVARYRIVCTTTKYLHPHEHIVKVEAIADGGSARQTFKVKKVRRMLGGDDQFYTCDPGGNEAEVKKFRCRLEGCDVKTIRSKRDATTANNLDNMPDG